jgi:hypothetical protein
MAAEIRIAAFSEASLVSEILGEAAGWLESRGVPLWSPEQVSLAAVSPDVQCGRFFLAWTGPAAVGTMRLTTSDPAFWPEAAPGAALYLHRLAVRRQAAGGQVSFDLLRWARARAASLGARYLRLDCETCRHELRGVYERFGFQYHGERSVRNVLVTRYQIPARTPEPSGSAAERS